MRKKKIIADNYLDFVPVRCKEIGYVEEGETIALKFENKGLFNRLVQLLFKKPKETFVHLDDYGTFVWLNTDGKATVYDIGKRLKDEFGDKTEPLYPRLVQYFHTMEKYGFVEIKKNGQ